MDTLTHSFIMTYFIRSLLPGSVAILFSASHSMASCPAPVANESLAANTPLFGQSYWTGFIDFWTKSLKNQDAVILIAIGLGVVGILIMGGGGFILKAWDMLFGRTFKG